MFTLYKNEKVLLTAPYWEDLVSFVDIVKKYNKRLINRKQFAVKNGNTVIYKWKRK